MVYSLEYNKYTQQPDPTNCHDIPAASTQLETV